MIRLQITSIPGSGSFRSGVQILWSLDDAQLLSSAYAIDEARRNLAMDRPEPVSRLKRLLEPVSAQTLRAV